MAHRIDPTARPIRVATYNIHRCVGTDGQRAPDRVAEVIRQIDADVIGLQEVDWQDDPDTGIPQPDLLASLTDYRAYAGPNLRDHRGHFGNLLLVRGAIGATRRIDISVPGREPRGAIEAEVETRGQRFRAVSTHFGLRHGERRAQAHMLAQQVLQGTSDPVLLLGDFNDWMPGAPALRPLAGHIARLGRAASFPARFPVFALDRLMVRGLEADGPVQVHRTALSGLASDHLPLFADIVATDGNTADA